jgi:hypothetical protein
MSRSLIFLSLGFVLLSASARAASDPSFLAKVYDEDSDKQRLLFTYQHESESKGDSRVITNTYKDKDGNLAALETVEFVKDGDHERVKTYKMSQKQLGTEGLVEVKEGKAHFSYTKGDSTKTAEESVGGDFVVGPSIIAYLQKNWDKIAKGEHVKARLAVPDRRETVGFEYFKDKEKMLGEQKAFVIKMKPSSFFIAALVKPLYFFMTPDGQTLLELHGRTQVKQKIDGIYSDLDAVTVYDYSSQAAATGNSK